MPSVIWAEQQRLPAGFLEQVIEYRSYATAYRIYQQNPKAEGDMVALVKTIEFEGVAAALAQHKQADGD